MSAANEKRTRSPRKPPTDISTAIPISIHCGRNCRRFRNPPHVPPRRHQNALPAAGRWVGGTVQRHARLPPENREK